MTADPEVQDPWADSVPQPPQDLDAERAVLGALMLSPDAFAAVRRELPSGASTFYHPAHQAIYAAALDLHARARLADPITLADELTRRGELERVGGAPYLHTCFATPLGAANATGHAEIVAEKAVLRRIIEAGSRLVQYGNAGTDAASVMARARTELDNAASIPLALAGPAPVEFDDFLAADLADPDWLVRDLLERQDRLIVTGPEGGGKSTWLRQLSVQFSSGIHPFGGDPFEPLKVLLLDVENSERQVYRALRPLRIQAGTRYQRGKLHLMIRPEGLALATDASDRAWFTDTIEAVRPDIVIGGPLYKIIGGKANEEEDARAVAVFIDKIRVSVGCAFITEAHSPHASNGGKRPTRPYGASLWLRWPEFGLHLNGGLDGDGALTHWRGPRDERDWPAMLQRGGEWPWTAVTRPRDVLWARIVDHCTREGARASERELAAALNTNKSTIHRVIEEHRAEWEAMA